ncbi:hypothetical protein FBQ82_15005 [Anaerolineae bacterium CFX7]|nr:hypothetical protein [Anaerolineae bacterium CFX7]
MNTTTMSQDVPSAPPRAFLAGASLAGAEGFAVAFAAMGMLMRVLSVNVTDPNLILAVGAFLYGTAGALGAAYLASATRWRAYTVLFALSGILGCGGGYLLTSLFLTARVNPESAVRAAVEGIAIIQHAIIGGLLGLFLGIVVGKPRATVWLILAGALGFGLGFLMQTSLNDLLAVPLSDAVERFTESGAIDLIVASLLWGMCGALGGLMGGGAIGYALER